MVWLSAHGVVLRILFGSFLKISEGNNVQKVKSVTYIGRRRLGRTLGKGVRRKGIPDAGKTVTPALFAKRKAYFTMPFEVMARHVDIET